MRLRWSIARMPRWVSSWEHAAARSSRASTSSMVHSRGSVSMAHTEPITEPV